MAFASRWTVARWLALALLTLLGGVALPCRAAADDAATLLERGAAIYREGRLPGGALLRGERDVGSGVEGSAAACTTCHRPSGLGSSEGRLVVPPIIGKYLFRSHSTNVHDLSLPHVAGYRTTREPYTAQTLARAIRDGVAPNGRKLNVLMPRFALDDAALAALTAYLTQLSSQPVPGVSNDVLHFATIITPDADPVARRGMLDVMTHFFADKNDFLRGGRRPMVATREIEYRVLRRWQLHVWELTGPPADWERQLRQHLKAEPVFAVISGLGGRTWAPVHHFCESERLPCLLPNVELPVAAEGDFYSVYFSRGVLLEADLMLHRLEQRGPSGAAQRVVQVFRSNDIGAAAATQLAAALRSAGAPVEKRPLDANLAPAAALAAALEGVRRDDLLVLWLRPADLAALPPVPPTSSVLLSGLMGGLEQAPLGADWRTAATMSYPFDLPQQRRVRMNFPLVWFKIRNIPVLSERVQTDTYVACGILAETLAEMLDSFVPDYLLERVEMMLSHRLVNGYYPRLSLGPDQRFASKGGYLVRFAGSVGADLAADGDWLVP